VIFLKEVKEKMDQIFKEMKKVIVGQDEVIRQVIVALLCDANVLLEGYPGLGKTTMIKTLASLMDLRFSRVQSTPDLMPSDITGTYVLEEVEGKRNFQFHKGPIFANIVLVDEINRATPKTQSALLESMQERQVTMGNNTFLLDSPFFVLATQNPIEQEGTYPLPEAQTDRFLLKIKVEYPNFEEEERIVDVYTNVISKYEIKKVFDKNALFKFQKYTREVPIAKDLKKKVLKIVHETRNSKKLIEYGASPRASIGLILTCKANALIEGRNYVSKKDIQKYAYPVLRHRIILNFEAERKGMTKDDAITEIIKRV
jgi:MoxR-like ATPase